MNLKFKSAAIVGIAASLPVQVFAQSTPAEFAEMSLMELYDLSLADDLPAEAPKWHLSYQFKFVEFDGYLDGDSTLSLDDVLWSGPQETRTDQNFPIVPTIIDQQAHLLGLGYQYSDELMLHLSMSFIRQWTDHISIFPDYDTFTIETKGIGDTVLSARYQFLNSDRHNWFVSFGVSLPTGSIDEVGDTPRSPGDQQLPYTMQLGSGTFDFPVELIYQSGGAHDFALAFSAMLRSGSNDRHYRLGNNYRVSARYTFASMQRARLFLGAEFQYVQAIRGRDDDLLVDGPFPFPASITNPNLYGGRKLQMRAGVTVQLDERYKMTVEYGRPLYQNLNGPQPEETWRSGVQISAAF